MTAAHPTAAGFWAFCALRQAAYWHKERGGAPPHSPDPAIGRYHFCNVYREADRGTIWFRDRVGEVVGIRAMPADGAAWTSYATRCLLWCSLAYRLVNRVATFVEYGGLPPIGRAEEWLRFLERRMRAGEKVFTGRHLNIGMIKYSKMIEALALTDGGALLDAVVLNIETAPTMAEVCGAVDDVPGVGRFFAWQVACDLLEAGALARVPDRDDWTLMGPGACAGAFLIEPEARGRAFAMGAVTRDAVAGAKAAARGEQDRALGVARRLRDEQDRHLRLTKSELVPPPQAPGPMRLKNVEHALCEYARYVRAIDPAVKAKGLEVKPWAR